MSRSLNVTKLTHGRTSPVADRPLTPPVSVCVSQGRGEAGRLRAGAAVQRGGPPAAVHQQGDHAVVPAARAAARRGALWSCHRHLELRLHPRGAVPQETTVPCERTPFFILAKQGEVLLR